MNETTNTPTTECFVNVFPSLDPEQRIHGAYSAAKPSSGFRLELPERITTITPQNAYLLHRALGEYMTYLDQRGETPEFWIQVKGLPADGYIAFGLDH